MIELAYIARPLIGAVIEDTVKESFIGRISRYNFSAQPTNIYDNI